jgi:hypothetical protein
MKPGSDRPLRPRDGRNGETGSMSKPPVQALWLPMSRHCFSVSSSSNSDQHQSQRSPPERQRGIAVSGALEVEETNFTVPDRHITQVRPAVDKTGAVDGRAFRTLRSTVPPLNGSISVNLSSTGRRYINTAPELQDPRRPKPRGREGVDLVAFPVPAALMPAMNAQKCGKQHGRNECVQPFGPGQRLQVVTLDPDGWPVTSIRPGHERLVRACKRRARRPG